MLKFVLLFSALLALGLALPAPSNNNEDQLRNIIDQFTRSFDLPMADEQGGFANQDGEEAAMRALGRDLLARARARTYGFLSRSKLSDAASTQGGLFSPMMGKRRRDWGGAIASALESLTNEERASVLQQARQQMVAREQQDYQDLFGKLLSSVQPGEEQQQMVAREQQDYQDLFGKLLSSVQPGEEEQQQMVAREQQDYQDLFGKLLSSFEPGKQLKAGKQDLSSGLSSFFSNMFQWEEN